MFLLAFHDDTDESSTVVVDDGGENLCPGWEGGSKRGHGTEGNWSNLVEGIQSTTRLVVCEKLIVLLFFQTSSTMTSVLVIGGGVSILSLDVGHSLCTKGAGQVGDAARSRLRFS